MNDFINIEGEVYVKVTYMQNELLKLRKILEGEHQ